MCQKAIYPGSFDPITYGHIDIIKRALTIFEEVIIAVANNSSKDPLFSAEERVKMIKQATKNFDRVSVESFNGLVVDYAHKKKINVIVRGLRMISDFEYEFQMALTNRKLAPDVETIYLMPSESYSYISSKLLKEASRLGANISNFVPKFIEEKLKKKLK
ncbi:MAG: pantetheine-phosphate adenylyltransferase [Candidatus Omnitrophica bacterium]|nr:pantetheine-phosphate adenylyltransferase [Candidatus Omnitrophota bacterium]